MPTSGGSSFQGGFEVVKRLWKMNLQPARAADDGEPQRALQARARQMGIAHFVFKPGLSKLDPEQFEADLRAFADKMVADVLPAARRRPPRAPPAAPRRRRKPRGGAAPADAGARRPPPAAAEELSREFAQLAARLEELRRRQRRHPDLRPGDEGGPRVLRARRSCSW